MFIIIVNLVIILFAVNHAVGNRPANRFVYSNVTGGYCIMD